MPHLNSIVPGVGHYDVTLVIHRNTIGTGELAVFVTLGTKELGRRVVKRIPGGQEFIRLDHLSSLEICLYNQKTVIVEISHNGLKNINVVILLNACHLIVLGEGHPPGTVEMFPQLAIKTIFGKVVTHGTEQLEPVQNQEYTTQTPRCVVPVVPCVRHQDLVLRVAGNIPGVEELAIA